MANGERSTASVVADAPRTSLTYLFGRAADLLAQTKARIAVVFGLLACRGIAVVAIPLIIKFLVDDAIPASRVDLVVLGSTCFLGLSLLDAVIGVAQRRQMTELSESIVSKLRMTAFERLLRASRVDTTTRHLGDALSRLNTDASNVEALIGAFVGTTTSAVIGAFTLATLAVLQWQIAVAGIATAPILLLFVRSTSARQRDAVREHSVAAASMQALATEVLSVDGICLGLICGAQGREVTRFRDRTTRVRETAVRKSVVGAVFMGMVGLVNAVAVALVYCIGGILVIKHVATLGALLACATYLATLYSSFRDLSMGPVQLAGALTSFGRVMDLVDAIPEETRAAVPVGSLGGRDVVLERVSVTYPPICHARASERSVTAPQPVALLDISARIREGEFVAVVGSSGAGKTTLAHVIAGFVRPSTGKVFVCGYEPAHVLGDQLPKIVGLVTQEPFVFHGSLKDNVLYGAPGASRQQLENVLGLVALDSFLSRLQNGVDTVIGERGYAVSGGERQRIALARVLLMRPPVLVCDEPTGNLDVETEAVVLDAINRLRGSTTCIVVTHRLITAAAADEVLVLDRGRLVQCGTHEQLVRDDGRYEQLLRHSHSRAPVFA